MILSNTCVGEYTKVDINVKQQDFTYCHNMLFKIIFFATKFISVISVKFVFFKRTFKLHNYYKQQVPETGIY